MILVPIELEFELLRERKCFYKDLPPVNPGDFGCVRVEEKIIIKGINKASIGILTFKCQGLRYYLIENRSLFMLEYSRRNPYRFYLDIFFLKDPFRKLFIFLLTNIKKLLYFRKGLNKKG
jgi:hypothetical protein